MPQRAENDLIGRKGGARDDRRTPASSGRLIVFVIVATLISHRFWALQGAERRTQTVQFAKNVAIIAGFLFAFVTGGGRLSLDYWRRRVE